VFFVLSKILGFFALPSNFLVFLGLFGLALAGTRLARTGRLIAAAAIILFAIAGIGPLGKALIKPLEDRFPPWDAGRGPPAGIVVLGGAIDPDFAALHMPDLNDAAERVAVVPALAKAYPNARIIYSGGNPRIRSSLGSEAQYAAPLFESFGIPKDRLTLEERSRNTEENAIYAKELAAPRPGERWLLVTSAYHMPRAIGAFRRAGFPVEAYPVDWRTRGPIDLWLPFESVTAGLRRTDTAVHEWIGLAAYRLTGRTSELFPAP
jgi:uncharacterized SAM-binding protein YcdF (DUF218 family)